MWKKLTAKWKTFIAKWRSETPRAAKTVRNTAGAIAAALPTAYMAVTGMGIVLPSSWQYAIGGITFAAVLITGIAGTKETNNGKSERQKQNIV